MTIYLPNGKQPHEASLMLLATLQREYHIGMVHYARRMAQGVARKVKRQRREHRARNKGLMNG